MAAIDKPPVTGAGPFNGVLTWVDQRFPLVRLYREQLTGYYAPKNFNFWYYFGVLSLVCLVIQIASASPMKGMVPKRLMITCAPQ